MNTNTQPKVYVLLKDLPTCKSGTLFTEDDSCAGYRSIDEYQTWFPTEFVEKDVAWFKEKQQPIEERIKIYDFHSSSESSKAIWYNFLTRGRIHPDKYDAIKLAIEQVLNNETWLQQQERIKMDKINKQAEVLFAPYDTRQTVDNTDLKTQPQDTKEDNPDWEIVDYLHDKRDLHSSVGECGCPIKSVRRKSDNEVFTVGDMVFFKEKTNPNWEIGNFLLKDDGTLLARSNSCDHCEFIDDNLKKAPKEEQKPVLFITYDGVNVYGGEHLYSVDNKTWGILSDDCNNAWEATLWNKGDDKIFSTKEAAEQFCIENKPCLSLKEVEDVFKEYNQYASVQVPFVIIKKLANTKINIQ